ncbi:MAG: chemotaxis protein CheB [Verrucomicrobiales bacterium]|nr:chemotaxis protein CheB [Verrucomicrobiales bacterium]
MPVRKFSPGLMAADRSGAVAPTPGGCAGWGGAMRVRERGRRYGPRPVVLIGASTGGTEALSAVLAALPSDLPGILIVQHIPAHFSRAFAERLNEQSRLAVREARLGDGLRPGMALVAPGGYHLLPRWVGDGYGVVLSQGTPRHHQRPSVDVLFEAAVTAGAGPHALAILLTGMGADGAEGMRALRAAGARTVAQDEASCVVFGMPREAIRTGAVQRVLPLAQMAAAIDGFGSAVALRPTPWQVLRTVNGGRV